MVRVYTLTIIYSTALWNGHLFAQTCDGKSQKSFAIIKYMFQNQTN